MNFEPIASIFRGIASANRPDRGQSEVRNGEAEARQDAPTNISFQRTEQQRDRPTNVNPKGQRWSADQNPLKRTDLDDFVACYNAKDRHERKESERFKSFSYEELLKRDKLNLDIFWLKDETLEDSANLAGLMSLNPACPATLDTLKGLGASRRKAGSR